MMAASHARSLLANRLVPMRFMSLYPVWMLLGAVLALAGCGPDVSDAPPVPERTQRALALLPADAQYAGMLDLQALQARGGIAFSSERGVTVRFLDSDLTVNPLSAEQQSRLQAFVEATGFEPGTDLHAAYMASDAARSRTLLLAADVDRARLVDELLATFERRLDTTSYRGAPILRLRDDDGAAQVQFALLDAGWMALSDDTPALRATIDRSLDAPSEASDRALQPLVDAVGGRGGAWLTLRDLPSQRIASSTGDARMNQLARAVRDIGSALQFTPDGVVGTVLLTTDQDAGDVADVIRGAISAVKMNQELTEEQRTLIDEVTVTPARGQVWIQFTVPQETLARLLIQSMRSGGGPSFIVAR